jgi:hypothetical protein
MFLNHFHTESQCWWRGNYMSLMPISLCDQSLHVTDGVTEMPLSVSLQHKTSAATFCPCQITLNWTLLHKFKKRCKFSCLITAKLHKKSRACIRYISMTVIIQVWGRLSNAFLKSIHAVHKCLWCLFTNDVIILLTSSWSSCPRHILRSLSVLLGIYCFWVSVYNPICERSSKNVTGESCLFRGGFFETAVKLWEES